MGIIALKVTLEYIEPAITRTLQVPSTIRLDRLHLTLQAAIGWTNSHLYMFEAEGAIWGLPNPDFGGDDLPANKTTLAEVIEDTGARSIRYIYDFGDGWEHRLQIGEITDPIPGDLYPRLTDISGRCPPEDVGGFPDTKSSSTPWPTPNTPNTQISKNGMVARSTQARHRPTNCASKCSSWLNGGSRKR